MTPFSLFKRCQNAIGRKYRGDESDFDSLDCVNFYRSSVDYFKEQFGRSDRCILEFLKVCSSEYGSRFDPFQITTDDYMKSYKMWKEIHSDELSYRKNILKSIQGIYNFCRDRDIHSLGEYVQRWSVSHITSGVLNENVAYILKVHDCVLTKPEKTLIKKKYLIKVKDIEERLSREDELKKFIVKNLKVLEKKISK